eukprot:25900_5
MAGPCARHSGERTRQQRRRGSRVLARLKTSRCRLPRSSLAPQRSGSDSQICGQSCHTTPISPPRSLRLQRRRRPGHGPICGYCRWPRPSRTPTCRRHTKRCGCCQMRRRHQRRRGRGQCSSYRALRGSRACGPARMLSSSFRRCYTAPPTPRPRAPTSWPGSRAGPNALTGATLSRLVVVPDQNLLPSFSTGQWGETSFFNARVQY